MSTVEELKIIVKAQIEEATKNLQKARKMLDQFGKDIKKQTEQSKKFATQWKTQFLVITGMSLVAMHAMIKASPTLSVSMYEMSYQFERVAYILGEQLGPAFEVLANIIGKAVDWFESLPAPVQQFIAAAITLTAVIGTVVSIGMTLGPILSMIGVTGVAASGGITVLGMSMTTLIPIIGLVIAAGALLYVAWTNNWFGIRDKTKAAISWLSTNIPKFIENVKAAWSKGVTLMKAIWTGDWKTIEKITSKITSRLPGPIGDALKLQLRLVKDGLGMIKAIFRGDWKAAAEYAKDALKGVLSFLTGLKDWMMKAGENLIKWFVSGFEKAKDWASEQVKSFTEWLASFFGGSLPERGALKNIVNYGIHLIEYYIFGLKKAKTLVEDQVKSFAEWLSGFFGGSLPERGPLKYIVRMGEELATAFTTGITAGMGKISPKFPLTVTKEIVRPREPTPVITPIVKTGGGTNINVVNMEPQIPITVKEEVSRIELEDLFRRIVSEMFDQYIRRIG